MHGSHTVPHRPLHCFVPRAHWPLGTVCVCVPQVMALRDDTVGALIVWRQFAPFPTMFAESLFLTNAIYRSTCSSTTGLFLITFGVVIYSSADDQFSWLGTLFTVLSTVMMVRGSGSHRAHTPAASHAQSPRTAWQHFVHLTVPSPLTAWQRRVPLLRCGRACSSATSSPIASGHSCSRSKRWC